MATIKTLIGNLKSSTYDTYSTNETVVGKWLDGKPLYRKIYETVMPAKGNVKYIDSGLSNYSYCKINAWMVWAGISGEPVDGFNGTAVWFDSSRIGLRNNNREDYANRTVYIQLEYTKTTD